MKAFILTVRYLLILILLAVLAYFCVGSIVFLYVAATFVFSVILLLAFSGNVIEQQKKVLIYAACKGKSELVKDLLMRLKSFDIKGPDGNLALRGAASRGHEDIVRMLLENGADPDAADSNGVSALMRAAFGGHLGTVEILCNAGASPRATDSNGDTALSKASANGHSAVVEYLEAR